MAGDITKVRVGAARIYVGVTAPASGTPPTLMTHTAGAPSTGTDVGFTENDCVFSYLAQKTLLDAEQTLGPVDAFIGSEMAKLTFTMKEHNYTALKLAFDNIGKVDDGSKTLFYAGGGATILTPTTQAIFFSAYDRTNTSKFQIGVIYKGVSMKGYESPMSKKNPGLIGVEIQGLLDLTRNSGDQMFQFYIEK